MTTIDLNADLGEGFPNDARLLRLVSSASLACGGHAGDEQTAKLTLLEAVRFQVVVGAHPGYADKEGFGRINQSLGTARLNELAVAQIQWLATIAQTCGVSLRYLKPHGALYNQAQDDPDIAQVLIQIAQALEIPIVGLPGSCLQQQATASGVRLIAEGFPERRYDDRGRLAPRSRPDAVIHDDQEIADQVLRLVDSGVETLCIHGDDPCAVFKAETMRHTLESRGIHVRSWLQNSK